MVKCKHQMPDTLTRKVGLGKQKWVIFKVFINRVDREGPHHHSEAPLCFSPRMVFIYEVDNILKSNEYNFWDNSLLER